MKKISLIFLFIFCSIARPADTYITGIFLSLLRKTVARSDHCGKASFAALLLELLGVGDLKTRESVFIGFHPKVIFGLPNVENR